MGFNTTYVLNNDPVIDVIEDSTFTYDAFVTTEGVLQTVSISHLTNKYKRILVYVTTNHKNTSFEARIYESFGGSAAIYPWDGENFRLGVVERAVIPGSGVHGRVRFPVHEAFPQTNKGIHTLEFRLRPLTVPVEFNEGSTTPNTVRILMLGVK